MPTHADIFNALKDNDAEAAASLERAERAYQAVKETLVKQAKERRDELQKQCGELGHLMGDPSPSKSDPLGQRRSCRICEAPEAPVAQASQQIPNLQPADADIDAWIIAFKEAQIKADVAKRQAAADLGYPLKNRLGEMKVCPPPILKF